MSTSTSNGATGSADRREGDRWDVHGAIVTTAHVRLARGWRHEVNVEYDAIDPPTTTPDGLRVVDPGGPVRKRDTLWLPDAGDALQLARAATDELRRNAGRWSLDVARLAGVDVCEPVELTGLSRLARELGLTTAEHA